MIRFLLFVLSASCVSDKHYNRDISGFETQVRAFETASNVEGKYIEIFNLTMKFDDSLTAKGKAGICYFGDQPKILISPSYWNRTNDIQKEILVFHELGHCILGRLHNDDLNLDIMPISIMYYSVGPWEPLGNQDYYNLNRSKYLHELFNSP